MIDQLAHVLLAQRAAVAVLVQSGDAGDAARGAHRALVPSGAAQGALGACRDVGVRASGAVDTRGVVHLVLAGGARHARCGKTHAATDEGMYSPHRTRYRNTTLDIHLQNPQDKRRKPPTHFPLLQMHPLTAWQRTGGASVVGDVPVRTLQTRVVAGAVHARVAQRVRFLTRRIHMCAW